MNQPVTVIVDYGVGNTHSVLQAIKCLNYRRVKVSRNHKDIADADTIILPGVGAFEACVRNLRFHQLDETLNEVVLIKKKPILGICVGMQLMAETSEENGIHRGLGWIPGNVVRLNPPNSFAVPHVGWNELQILSSSPLFSRTPSNPHFYFDHSYHFQCDARFIAATCDYSCTVTSAISHNHIHAVQFHPEKSQNSGLRLFRGFFNSVKEC
jgi:glutamine amidotransferase